MDAQDKDITKSAWKAAFSRPSVIIILVITLINAFVYWQVIGFAQDVDKTAQQGNDLAQKLEQEGQDRRDQACLGVESQHKEEIENLKQSYTLLLDPPPELASLLKNPLVIKGIQEDEAAAADDSDELGVFVAPYCDDPNTGLKEPDPDIPQRPKELDNLLSSTNG